jgi:3-oxoacyl-[acyl-carrier-protein] synthase-1
MNVYLNHLAMISALGNGVDETRKNLFNGASPGMMFSDKYSLGKSLYLGTVGDNLPSLSTFPLEYRSRNNQVLLGAFKQIENEIIACIKNADKTRIAVVMGSSTSGISEEEDAMKFYFSEGEFPPEFHLNQREFASPARFLAYLLNIKGPSYTISTACTSSAKAIISGARLLNTGLFDYVVAGGVDTLCQFTVAGFSALESVSDVVCNPFSANRKGINIGEAAALFLMSRNKSAVRLSGWGESSDGYHISAPDPFGNGAKLAISKAVSMAGIYLNQIEYINLHGTSTIQNDAMEASLIHSLGLNTPVSSTKPLTGHALGAAGAIETAICWMTLTDSGRLPPHIWDSVQDQNLPRLNLETNALNSAPSIVMNNNFAFGGNNTSLILERE